MTPTTQPVGPSKEAVKAAHEIMDALNRRRVSPDSRWLVVFIHFTPVITIRRICDSIPMKNKYIVTGIQNNVAAVRRPGSLYNCGYVDGAKYLTVGEEVELADREVIGDGQLDEYEALHNRYTASAASVELARLEGTSVERVGDSVVVKTKKGVKKLL